MYQLLSEQAVAHIKNIHQNIVNGTNYGTYAKTRLVALLKEEKIQFDETGKKKELLKCPELIVEIQTEEIKNGPRREKIVCSKCK